MWWYSIGLGQQGRWRPEALVVGSAKVPLCGGLATTLMSPTMPCPVFFHGYSPFQHMVNLAPLFAFAMWRRFL
jgi:hypothetical protein